MGYLGDFSRDTGRPRRTTFKCSMSCILKLRVMCSRTREFSWNSFTRRRLRRRDPRCCQTRLRLVVTELRSLERGERRDRPRRNWRCFRLTKLRMELLPRKHQQRSKLLQKPSASENKNFQKINIMLVKKKKKKKKNFRKKKKKKKKKKS